MSAFLDEIIDRLDGEPRGGTAAVVSEARAKDFEVVRVPTAYVGTHYAAGATFVRTFDGVVYVSIDGKAPISFPNVRDAVEHYISEEF